MTEDELLQIALKEDDAPFLLDLAISALYIGRMDPSLALWLARRLERVLHGEDAGKLFKLNNPEGAPAGKHGAGRYDTHSVLALRELARRRFQRKHDADDAVAKACGYKDAGSVSRLVRESGYELDRAEEEMLKVMAGDELLKRVEWPKKPGEN